ncbi:hypothetical protein AVEN_197939-1 [Araneus ventricosus]|uniref:C2H2-type domain-containing protein n=1 Tax=Araneus ventricosus TaxID=182803 RepID=A0A4Y2UHQ3_ARAVE|nr:hypothetical protein AVEN_197939-1 [Araneus ventricosus]
MQACSNSSYLCNGIQSSGPTTNMRVRLNGDPSAQQFADDLPKLRNDAITLNNQDGCIVMQSIGRIAKTHQELKKGVFPNVAQHFIVYSWLCQRGFITVDELDSLFEDDENDTVDPVFPCTLCGETVALPSSLKNHERLRHGNKRQRRDPSQQPGPYSLQSGGGAARKRIQRRNRVPRLYNQMLNGPRKQRRDSSPHAGPSNLQSV